VITIPIFSPPESLPLLYDNALYFLLLIQATRYFLPDIWFSYGIFIIGDELFSWLVFFFLSRVGLCFLRWVMPPISFLGLDLEFAAPDPRDDKGG
jgi:hypothetical protein